MDSVSKENLLTQQSETQAAKLVFLHQPTFEAFLTSLNPCASLYECPLDMGESQQNHLNIKKLFQQLGTQVITLEWLVEQGLKDKNKCEFIYNYAMTCLQYKCDYSESLLEVQKSHLSNEYKKSVIQKQSLKHLLQVILCRPTIHLRTNPNYPVSSDLEVIEISTKPIGNLTFQRDGLIVTNKGPIVGRLTEVQRFHENEIVKFMLDLMDVKFVQIPQGCTLEGGDYVPATKIAFIGIGARSSFSTLDFLLENDLFGVERVAAVIDNVDKNIERMHLDTVFNIVDEERVVLHEGIIGANPKYPRTVTEYVYNQNTKKYNIVEKGTPFDQYLKKNGYQIIPISEDHQLQYMINFLNAGNNTIISVHKDLESILKKHGYQGKVEFVEYSGILKMYGAAHCSTQVFREGSKYKIFTLESK